MKYILTTCIALLVFSACETKPQAVQATTFVLMRHAEKAKDDPRDPSLNEKGEQRALAIAELFKRTTPAALYATSYKRTQATLAPLADSLNLEILTYDLSNEHMIEEILEEHQGGLIFISGHSNTTPALVNQLIGTNRYETLAEDDYGTMFWVTITGIGMGSAQTISY